MCATLASSDAPDVSVVIVNYNVRAFVAQALRSIDRASSGLKVETFVVDNASADDSVAYVRRHFPHVCVVANEANVGFGKANNQAIERARGRHVFVLNPDTIVQEDTLRTLVAFLDTHPEAGAVGPMILNPDGTFAPESRRSFPTPEVAFYRIAGLSRLFPGSRRFGRYNMTYLPRDEVAEVDALSGSCMMVRREAIWGRSEVGSRKWEVGSGKWEKERPEGDQSAPPSARTGAGLFDEDFFMYGEDLDWCFRIQRAGWKIFYTPDTQIIHYKGESTKKGELRYVRLFYGAMLLFAQKHFGAGEGGGLLGMGLRAAIVGRAALGVLKQWTARLAPVVLDALLCVLALVLAHAVRFGDVSRLGPRFFLTIGLLFPALTVLGTLAFGGYRWRRTLRRPPPVAGVTVGLLLVAALSFFVKDVAFSRFVLGLAYLFALGLLVGWRMIAHARQRGTGRAVFVGPKQEAERLRERLATHPRPPFELVGYVFDRHGRGPVRYLGPLRNLRAYVRFERADNVVFSPDALPAYAIFGQMRALSDLPVQFRMMAPDGPYVIGKASVDAVALVEAEAVVGRGRSALARRLFEVGLALALRAVRLLARHRAPRDARWQRVAHLGNSWWDLLAGRVAVVGYDAHAAYRPPEAWGLRPGLIHPPHADDPERAYGQYAQHESARVDLALLRRYVMGRTL